MKSTVCAVLAASAILAGCSSVGNFNDMSAQERAVTACSRVFEIYYLNNQIRSIERSAGHMSGNLGRGYAVHQDCYYEDVPETAQTNCRNNGYGQIVCDTTTTTKKVKRCRDMPVAINPELEKEKLNDAYGMATSLKSQRDVLFKRCYNSVVKMSPDEAYAVFKTREMP